MPTLIRLFVVLIVLAGLVLAGMIGLTVFVQPSEKEIRVRIPPQQLGMQPQNDPLGIRTLAPPLVLPEATTTVREPEPLPPGVTETTIPE